MFGKQMASAVVVAALFIQVVHAKKEDSKPFDLSGDRASQAGEYVKGKNLESLKGLRKVAISSFQVEFAVENKASAYGGGASAKAQAILAGIDDKTFQAIADGYYDRLAADLAAAGLEVVPFETIKAAEYYQKFKSRQDPSPVLKRSQDGKSLYYSAHGMPVYFRSNDLRLGAFSSIGNSLTTVHPQNYEPRLAKELGAAVLRVRAVVDIAKQSGRGNYAAGASVKTTAELSLMPDFTEYMFVIPDGKDVTLTLEKYMNAEEKVLALTEAEKSSMPPLDLSGLGGGSAGGQARAKYLLETTPENYSRVVGAHLEALEAMFLSVIKANV